MISSRTLSKAKMSKLRVKVKVGDLRRIMIPVASELTVDELVAKISSRLSSFGLSYNFKSVSLGGYALFGKDLCGDVLSDGDEVEVVLSDGDEVEVDLAGAGAGAAVGAATAAAAAAAATADAGADAASSASSTATSASVSASASASSIMCTIFPASGDSGITSLEPSASLLDLHAQASKLCLPKGVDVDDFDVHLCTEKAMLLLDEDEMKTGMSGCFLPLPLPVPLSGAHPAHPRS